MVMNCRAKLAEMGSLSVNLYSQCKDSDDKQCQWPMVDESKRKLGRSEA